MSCLTGGCRDDSLSASGRSSNDEVYDMDRLYIGNRNFTYEPQLTIITLCWCGSGAVAATMGIKA